MYLLPAIEKSELCHTNTLAVCSIPLPTPILTNQSSKITGSAPYVFSSDNFIIHCDTDISQLLGSGQFGTVVKGTLNGNVVAVKTVKENVDKIYIKSLLSELKVLIYLGNHPNIVGLMGAHTTKMRRGKIKLFL